MVRKHERSLVLHAIADFERTSGIQVPQISAIAFTPEATYIAAGNGRSRSFRKGVARDDVARLAGLFKAKPDADTADMSMEWEQWHETLSDLATYPSYFEDLCPGMEPDVVQRFSDCVIFSFVDDGRIVRYRYRFDADNQFPLALPDEVRRSFSDEHAIGPFLERL